MATLRLSQVARKLNIGKNTIVDFLASKGFEVEDNPNHKITQDQLTLLSKEFADSALDKEEASGLKIGSKLAGNVVIDAEDDEKSHEPEEEEEILIKNVAGAGTKAPAEDEVVRPDAPKLQGIKVVGKIDLGKKKEEAP